MKGVLARMKMLASQIYAALLKSGMRPDSQAEDVIFNSLRKFFKV